MKFKTTFRIFGIAIIMNLLATVIPVKPTLASDISIYPSSGNISDNINIIGTDFRPSDPDANKPRRVDIYFTSDEAEPGDRIGSGYQVTNYKVWSGQAIVGDTDAGDEGEFTTSIMIPSVLDDGYYSDVDVEAGETYYICATQYGDLTIRAVAEITITPIKNVNVTYPNGGESWTIGSTHTINWKSSSSPAGTRVKIELSRDSGSTWSTIVPSTHKKGRKTWKVTGPGTTHARIKVSSVADPNVYDVSNGDFTITVP